MINLQLSLVYFVFSTVITHAHAQASTQSQHVLPNTQLLPHAALQHIAQELSGSYYSQKIL